MDIKTINKRLISGFLSLSFGQALLLGLNFFVINIFLARILPVETIGIFNIGNTFISLFTFFSDIGLAAALIQKKDITEEDLRSTFLIQEIIALVITIIIWFSAPYFSEFYKIGPQGLFLIRALGVSFFLTSFKVIPSILLERELKFIPLVIANIVETAFYLVTLVILSLMNHYLDAFSYSAILRSISGVIALYIFAPWKIGLSFSKSSLKSLLHFGVPFQINSTLALLKDRLVPLIIASMIGKLGMGYIAWAQNLALLPMLIVTNLIRLTFPTFSRLQDNEGHLKYMLERAIFLTSLIAFPLVFGLVSISPALVEHVVTDKWKPALPLIYLFSINTLFAVISTTFTNFLNAIGKIKITLYLMVMWTILTWILSPLFVMWYGFLGAGIATAVISITSIIPVIITQRIIKVELIKNIYQPFLASVAMSAVVYIISLFFTQGRVSTFIVAMFGGLVYALIIVIFWKEKVIRAVKGSFDEAS